MLELEAAVRYFSAPAAWCRKWLLGQWPGLDDRPHAVGGFHFKSYVIEVELAKRKRTWLSAFSQPKQLLSDVTELHNDSAFNYITEEEETLPVEGDVLVLLWVLMQGFVNLEESQWQFQGLVHRVRKRDYGGDMEWKPQLRFQSSPSDAFDRERAKCFEMPE